VLTAHLAADAEDVADAGDHQRVDIEIAVGQHRGLLDAVVHLDGARVAPLRPVDDDAQRALPYATFKVLRTEIDALHPRDLPGVR
jgi:hypothetical protein